MPVTEEDPIGLVSPEDVEAALLRPLTDVEAQYLPARIRQATSKLRTAMPSLDTRMAAWSADPRPASAIDPQAVAAVLAEVLKRALVNPKGLWSRTETTGPFSESETYPGARGGPGAAEGSGGIVITAADLAQLVPAARGRRPRTMRLHPGMAPGNIGTGTC